MKTPSELKLLAAFAIAMTFAGAIHAAEPPKTPPDLTVTNTVDRKLTYNLGPTGLRGWIHTRAANFRESQQGRTTTASRQILVTQAEPRRPSTSPRPMRSTAIIGMAGAT